MAYNLYLYGVSHRRSTFMYMKKAHKTKNTIAHPTEVGAIDKCSFVYNCIYIYIVCSKHVYML